MTTRRWNLPCLLALVGCLNCWSSSSVESLAEDVADEPGITWRRVEKWPSLGPMGFRLPEFPNDTFILVFPEWITAREMYWHVKPQWTTRRNSAVARWKSDDYSLELKTKFSQVDQVRTLAWEYRFTNGSDRTLTDVAAFNCFNLVDAPSFKDLKMERTWVGDDQRRTALAGVKKTTGSRTMQFYPARDGLKLTEFERFMRYGVTSREQLTGDRIGVRSRDGRWALECIVDGRTAYFFNNWESDHGCLHAAPLLGNIPAGKSTTAKGRIVFTQEELK